MFGSAEALIVPTVDGCDEELDPFKSESGLRWRRRRGPGWGVWVRFVTNVTT